ncbi:MAG TPA: hypothetical protein DCY94_04400, partial [Firmicutes bacterium]|nr:hypothetical protein [Bacillota bacterium]
LEQYERLSRAKNQLLKYEKAKLKRYKEDSVKPIEKTDFSRTIDDFLANPGRTFLSRMIDKIYISENGSIDIYYNIRKPRNLS